MGLRDDMDAVRRAAAEAATRWRAPSESVELLGSSANAVFAMGSGEERRVLRLTDARFRSREAIDAELRILQHVRRRGAQVCEPHRSVSGTYVEDVVCDGDALLACVFSWAPGRRVDPGTPAADDGYYCAWGRALGTLHLALRDVDPAVAGARPHWREHLWVAQAGRFIPPDDHVSRHELEHVRAWAASLSEDDAFGLVHGDFGPQNFHCDPRRGVTAFDFDDCCRHFLFMDLVISLSTLLRLPRTERDRCRELIFEGYATEHPLRAGDIAQLDWFLRLRALYVYVSRLWAFGSSPAPAHQAMVAQMRDVVHRGPRW